eukprot:5093159-Alexandrium_andersonii.AAC.1
MQASTGVISTRVDPGCSSGGPSAPTPTASQETVSLSGRGPGVGFDEDLDEFFDSQPEQADLDDWAY